MTNSCPFPKSSMVTDLLVDCSTNILTIIQTAPDGSEHSQTVDMSCILPQETHIDSASYDCDNDILIIIERTEGECGGPDCLTTFTVDMSCIRDGLMPSCDNLVSVTPAPVGSELVVCTPGGAFKTEIAAIITELDCSLVPPVCCPRPPLAEFLVCNEGEISRLPASDVFTCDDIPAAADLATDPTVVVCGSRGMEKVTIDKIQLSCADFPIQDPPPALYTLLACEGGNLISVPEIIARGTDVVAGQGIDVGLIAGAETDTFTITLDLCDLPTDTYANLSVPGPIYMAVCVGGLNYKMPYVESSGGTVMADGTGTLLSGDGSVGDPYVVDLALCEVTDNVTYDESASIAACLVGSNIVMPAIKAGTNVVIDTDGTLNVPTITGVVEFLAVPITLWNVAFDSAIDPNHSATIPTAAGAAWKGLVVDIEMDGYVKTANTSGGLEKIQLQALIDGVQYTYWGVTILDTLNGMSNQFSTQVIIPFDGGIDVDVALNWAFVGVPTADASVTSTATIVGVILA